MTNTTDWLSWLTYGLGGVLGHLSILSKEDMASVSGWTAISAMQSALIGVAAGGLAEQFVTVKTTISGFAMAFSAGMIGPRKVATIILARIAKIRQGE